MSIEAIRGMAMRWLRRMFRYNSGVLMSAAAPVLPVTANRGVQVSQATAADSARIAAATAMTEERVGRMMATGAVCFVATVNDGELAGFSWSAFGRCYIRGMGLDHDFGDDHYSFASLVLMPYRRQGVYLALKQAAAALAKERGSRTFWVLIENSNQHSFRLQEKMGFEIKHKVWFLKLFGLRMCLVRNVADGRLRLRLFLKEPEGDITVV